MKLIDFDYTLPSRCIAQHPLSVRSQSKLMIVRRKDQKIIHDSFCNIGRYLNPGDVLVLNDTKVLPSRLKGHKLSSACVEVTLSRNINLSSWYVFTKSRAKISCGDRIYFDHTLEAEITHDRLSDTHEIQLRFNQSGKEFINTIDKIGYAPLPPYIKRVMSKDYKESHKDREQYQCIYASKQGSVAAPTAGLHFDKKLISVLENHGIKIIKITLHVGPGTFKPVTAPDLINHKMLSETYEVSEQTVELIQRHKALGNKIIAVGSTSTRVLETIFNCPGSPVNALRGETDLFVYPPYTFRMTDILVTNFHLPKSTLLMLISAFGGMELIRKAYAQAIHHNYRFYSYGDAMMILS